MRIRAWIRRLMDWRPIDRVFVFSGQMGQYVPANWRGRLVVDLVDVDSAKFESYSREKTPPMCWIDAREGRLLKREEQRLATLADRALLISEAEAACRTADIIVTVGLLPFLWPWARPLLGAVFSMDELRRCLRFGLPRLPHGLAQQSLDAGNKYLLNQYVPLASLGVYNISGTIGQSMKLFLSAFETGWAPFYYETARQPDAQLVFAKITTYGIAILALLVAGLTAITPDLIRLMTLASPWTTEDYALTAIVVPLIALGVAFQGVYLLTSIGLNLTSQTQYYPVAAFAAAGVGLGSGLLLMPRMGAIGAAIAFLLSYITLAATAGILAQRHYAVRYEWGRLVRVLTAAAAAVLVGLTLPDMPRLAGFLAQREGAMVDA